MSEVIKFKDFVLDRFQIEAFHSIENNHSVVVSAATGTGKTLIADFVIHKYLNEGMKIVYTAPIKALSNQKYNDFRKDYGDEKVGILTGDVTINHDAPLLIMTTEIYRNMLLSNDPFIDDVAYVVFDEIHFLGDVERGTVWEESIIFSKEHTRFLCLSATIPNAKQFANWISHVKNHPVDVVTEKKRAVPLKHMFYDSEHGFAELDQIKEWKNLDNYPKYYKSLKHKQKAREERMNVKRKSHIDLVNDLKSKDKLPCIYFCFSRLLTEQKSDSLKRFKNYLNAEESTEAGRIIREKLGSADVSIRDLKTTKLLRECLSKGIGFHHAGLLSVLKELVEDLFGRGLVKILFATETFAVGINMPARTVCFDSLEKFDGISFRHLNSKEYFQLAGRAGRRGIDKEGLAVSVIDRRSADIERIKVITSDDKEPLKSQFKVSFNTVLNLLRSHTAQEQELLLKKSFYAYQQLGTKGASRIVASFEKKKGRLLSKGFIYKEDGSFELSEQGLFASRIYSDELVVTNIFCSDRTKNLGEREILLLAGVISFEERRNTKFKSKYNKVTNNLFDLFRDDRDVMLYLKKKPVQKLEQFLISWLDGMEFVDVMEFTNILEGDIVRLIRQIIDLLQQIQHATLDDDLRKKVIDLRKKIDRDVISVSF
jgi:superfamily II RNA helicase